MDQSPFFRSAIAAAVSLAIGCAVQAAEPADELGEVVVTARAGRDALPRNEASFALTTLDAERLALSAPLSTAEVFKNVPGFWVEASGGEGSNNIRARGIPLDGYSAISLQENGMPVQYDGGLGYLNADQSFRLDATIERVEAVRGGPASIFAPNAPGGVVNFISRRGGEGTGNYAKFTLGDYGMYRLDGYHGGGNDGWRYLVGGFFRQDDGIRDPGFTANKGGQIRFTVGRDFDGGSFTVDARHLDDKVAFYLPVPLTFDTAGNITGVPGFDPTTDTLAGPENAHVLIKNTGAPYDFDLTRGSHTKLTQLTGQFVRDLPKGFQLQENVRLRQSDIQRNGLFPTGNVQTLAAQLSAVRTGALAAFAGATDVAARYATDGQAFSSTTNGNGLVVGGNLLAVHVPLNEFVNDLRLTNKFEFGSSTHDVAIGYTYANYDYRFDRYMGTSVLEVAGQARRLDIVAVNAAGSVVGKVTDNGFIRYGSLFDEVGMGVRANAFYLSDEWQVTPALRIDAGLRYEQTHIKGAVAGKKTVNLGDATTLADDSVTTGNGSLVRVDRKFEDSGWTLGANYQLAADMGVFARYTESFRLPSAGEYNGNPTRTDQTSIPISLAEFGLKRGGELLSVYATGFYTKFDGVRFTDNVFNSATNSFVQRFATASTETVGVELEGRYAPMRMFDLTVNATWQDPRYKGFRYADVVNGVAVQRDFSEKQLIRVPRLGLRAIPALNLLDGRLRTELEVEHYSKRYPDVANSQVLPEFTLVNLNVRAALSEKLSLNANITNLTDEIGLTEGNPRAGSFISGDAGARYFLARPGFGRAIRASVSYEF